MSVPNTFVPGTLILADQVNENFDAVVSNAELAASSGAAGVGFIQAGVTATARTAQAKMRDTVSVLDFGAVGDGVADDTVAINNALAASNCVLLPAGKTFLVTSTIYVGGNKALIGQGFTSVIRGSGVSGPIVCLGVPSGTRVDNGIAQSFTVSGTATEGFRINNNITCIVSDIALYQFTGTNGFVFYNTFGSTLSHLRTNGSVISNACFYIGTVFNANFASDLYTSNFCTVNFLMDATYPSAGSGGSTGNSFANLTAQGGNTGLFFRNFATSTVNGYYSENVGLALKFGEKATNNLALCCSVQGGKLNGPEPTNGGYSSRYACVDFNYAYYCGVDTLRFSGAYSALDEGATTITDATGTGARVLARLKTDGTVHSAVVLRGGSGYSATPTITLDQGGGATFTATVVGGAITAVAVTNPGSGLTVVECPYTITYTTSVNSYVRNSYFDAYTGLWPLFMRNAGAGTGSAVSIYGDISTLKSSNPGDVDIRKAAGFAYRYIIVEYDANGALANTVYIPPEI